MKREILKAIRPIRRKLHMENCLNTWFVFTFIGSVLVLGVSVFAHFMALPFGMNWMIGIGAGVSGIGLVSGLIRYPNRQKVLKVTDSLGAKERLQTSFELLDDDSEPARLQREETLQFLENFSFSKHYKMTFLYKYLLMAIVIMVAAFGLYNIDSPAKQEAMAREELSEKLLEEKEEFLKEKDELLEKYEISEDQKKELEETLKPLLEKLEEAKSEEEALKQLSIAKDEIKKLNLDEELNKLEGLQELAKQMNQLSEKGNDGAGESGQGQSIEEMKEMAELMKELAEKLKDKEIQVKLDQAMKNLAEILEQADLEAKDGQVEEKTKEEIEASIEDLENLLEQLAEMDPGSQLAQELAEQINEMAISVSSQPSVTDLAFGSQSTSGSSASSSTSSETPSTASGDGSESGESQGSGDGSESGEGQGSGDGSESGEGQGSGDGSGSGEGQGSGDGSGSGSGQGGQGSGSGGEGRGYGTTDEFLFDPSRLGGDSEPSFVKGNRLEGGETDSNQVEGQPMENGEMVNYQELYREYFQQATETVDHLDVPVVMKDIILEYFSDIED